MACAGTNVEQCWVCKIPVRTRNIWTSRNYFFFAGLLPAAATCASIGCLSGHNPSNLRLTAGWTNDAQRPWPKRLRAMRKLHWLSRRRQLNQVWDERKWHQSIVDTVSHLAPRNESSECGMILIGNKIAMAISGNMIVSVGPLGIRTGAPQPVLQTVPCHLEENPNPTIAALAS